MALISGAMLASIVTFLSGLLAAALNKIQSAVIGKLTTQDWIMIAIWGVVSAVGIALAVWEAQHRPLLSAAVIWFAVNGFHYFRTRNSGPAK